MRVPKPSVGRRIKSQITCLLYWETLSFCLAAIDLRGCGYVSAAVGGRRRQLGSFDQLCSRSE